MKTAQSENEAGFLGKTVTLDQFRAERAEALESQLVRKLLDYLLSGAVVPGGRLPSERALAASLQVGRQAVRNAIKSLAALGIIETRVGSGSYLVSQQSSLLPRVIEWGILLSQTWATDLIDARHQLEVLLAGMAAERRTEVHLGAIREAYAAMQASGDDYVAYAEADAEFHLAVADASENVLLAGVLRNIRYMLKAWAVHVITTAGETETSLPLHEGVLRAIEMRDPKSAQEAMERHMERAVRRLHESQQ